MDSAHGGVLPGGGLVGVRPTGECHILRRQDIDALVHVEGFGRLLTDDADRAVLFDTTASYAKRTLKHTDVVSLSWTLEDLHWTLLPTRRQGPSDHTLLAVVDSVFEYATLPAGSMVVDFANRCVGGGCFSRGFVQEEQMVVQSADFAARLRAHRPILRDNEVISFSGVHFDAWWDRDVAACRGTVSPYASLARASPPLVVLAANAPRIHASCYVRDDVQLLAAKILLLFYSARALHCPELCSGLLGGGAFRGNRPLVLLLHMLVKATLPIPLRFHLTIFRSFSRCPTLALQLRARLIAEAMRRYLGRADVSNLEQVISTVSSWSLPSSHNDADLSDLVCRRWGVPLWPDSPAPPWPPSNSGQGTPPARTSPSSERPRCFSAGCMCPALWAVTGVAFGDGELTVTVCLEHLVSALRQDAVATVVRL